MSTWWSILTRRKRLEPVSDSSIYSSDKKLSRILSTFDLTALGVGSTLGVGVYVIAGQVSKDLAGPSVILSFLIAAVASVFAGLCYAEFGARVPKAGSAYNYSYICVGEFIAFIIGWNLILEYVIGSASVARGLSLYVDTLVNNTLKDTFREIAPIDSSFLSEYFDFFAFAITMVLGVALAFGLKESSIANNIFTIINIGVVLFVIIAGAFKADGKNWRIAKKDIPDGVNGGEGGFFPFGIAGTIKGAATCFYGFVGFDCIATTAEEVKNPRKAVPIAIILSLFIVFLSYFGTSAIVTLMCPYYLQDPDAPIPHAFEEMGWIVAKWIVAIGGIFGLCASLFGAMFPLPRIVYAMASDALVFRFLGRIHDRFGTLVIGTLLAALLTGLMSAVFNLKQLVNMMSIGTLMAYTIVAACVIILRYSIDDEEIAEWGYALLDPDIDSENEYDNKLYDDIEITEDLNLISPKQGATFGKVCKQLFNFSNRKATYITQKIVTVQVFVFSILSLIFAAFMAYLQEDIQSENLWVVIPTAITFFLMLLTLISIYAQPNTNKALTFQVPFVPLIPAVSIAINLYLMMMLDANTWIRFAVWMAVGLPIYITCCILYKRSPKKPEHISGNGHISHVYTNQENLRTLTIPKIVVDPPANGNLKLENHFQNKSTTEEQDYVRKYSIDITEVNKAVYELDKVLNDTEESYENFERVEAINDTEQLKKKTFKDCDNHSIISTDSESAKSEEHHIEAIVHQEDELCEKCEENKNDDKVCEKIEVNKKDEEVCEKGVESIKEDESLEQHEIHEEVKQQAKEENEQKVEKENEQKMQEENNENETPKVDESIEEKDHQVETLQDKIDKEIHEEKVSEISPNDQKPSELKPFIPAPPPMAGLSITPLNHPFPHPKTKRRAPLPPQLKLEEISLRPTPKSRLTRSESVASDESEDNAKIGSEKYQRVKAKLESVFKNYKPLKLHEQKYYDKTPSPIVVKEIDMLDKILEPYEEIPPDYSKSDEFKDTLSKLLSKKTSRAESFQYVRKYEKNTTAITEEQRKRDEIKHRKLMNDTFRSIKLRKTGLLHLEKEDEPPEEHNTEVEATKYDESKQVIITNKIEIMQKFEMNKENENINERKNSEVDREEHKRLMIATLRSIKLRKTGISISETDHDDTNSIKETGR